MRKISLNIKYSDTNVVNGAWIGNIAYAYDRTTDVLKIFNVDTNEELFLQKGIDFNVIPEIIPDAPVAPVVPQVADVQPAVDTADVIQTL